MASGTQAAFTRRHEITVYNKDLGLIVKRIKRIITPRSGHLFCIYQGMIRVLFENEKGYYIVED